ncbi:hypothetical protein [Kitasatospora camelliae]|uniref:Small secreted protein n=1 Tax=Kitasatospora camelliae TaxID=3156397 RepID=A0AAU8K2B9_9ACTN
MRARALGAALAVTAALLLTACGPGGDPAPDSGAAVQQDDAQVNDLQQKLDAADSAATQADEDAAKGDG